MRLSSVLAIIRANRSLIDHNDFKAAARHFKFRTFLTRDVRS